MPDFQVIPSIEALRQRPATRALEGRFGPAATVDALRAAAAGVRSAISGGDRSIDSEEAAARRIEHDAQSHLTAAFGPSLQAVINATGVIVHTNLGRAPLATTAIE